MGGVTHSKVRFRSLVVENRKLVARLANNAQAYDQLFAAQKELLKEAVRAAAVREGGGENNPENLTPSWLDMVGAMPGELQAKLRRNDGRENPDRECAFVVVEDSPHQFVLLKQAFRQIGAAPRTWWAQTPQDVTRILAQLESLAKNICVVAELRLPGVENVGLLRSLRRGSFARVKFAFLTGYCDPATRDWAYACGADGVFYKPMRLDELIELARALQLLVRGSIP